MLPSKQMRDNMEIIEITNLKKLSFGANTNQSAAIAPIEQGIEYEILSNNKNLEYIDYLNLTKVVNVLSEFFDVNATAIAKENFISAAALGSSIDSAFEKTIDCNPLAITGATFGASKELTETVAKQLCAMKIKNVIAPAYNQKALKYLFKNENINIIQIKSPLQELLGFNVKDIQVTPFGYLIQEQNTSKLTKSSFKTVGTIKPTQTQAEDAIFAWKISKYTKRKSAVIVKDLAVKAIVQGMTNEIDTVESAMNIACENSKDSVMSVDGVIENIETINAAIQGRIGLIIEAGDGINSDKIVKHANKYNIAIIKTGIRNNEY